MGDNLPAPGRWTINENGELEPDDDKAKDFNKTVRAEAERTGQKITYCLYDARDACLT